MKDFEAFEEPIDLVGTHGLIEVRGDDFDSALLIGGKPDLINWCDCGGSIAQYLVRAGLTDYESALQTLRNK